MATKKRPAPKKAPQKSSAKKPMPPKKNSASSSEKDFSSKSPRKGRSTACKVLPYVFIVFALILAIALVIVRLFGIDDGAGAFGYGILWLLGGFFGTGTVLLPLGLGYIGVKWCLHNVNWKDSAISSESESYTKARGRLVLQSVMTALSVLFFSILFATIANGDYFDFGSAWSDGAEDLRGGGILGGLVSYGLVAAFASVLTYILVILLLLIFTMLALGLTPDYIIEKIQESRAVRAEERAREWEEQLAEEEANQTNKRTAAAAAAAATVKTSSPKQEDESQDDFEDEIPDLIPPDETLAEPDIYIGPVKTAAKDAAATAAASAGASAPTAEVGVDYGDDSSLDQAEYDNIDELLSGLNFAEDTEAKAAEPELTLGALGAEEIRSDLSAVAPEEAEEAEEEEIASPYIFPPIDLLLKNKQKDDVDHTEEAQENAKKLLSTLQSFRINIQEIQYSRGPTITRYELRPEAGVRVRSIANLVDDIALSLATSGVRIEAPIPGKPFVGIEVPNKDRATVYLRDLIENTQFTEAKSKLTASLGMDVGGNPVYFDITKMPHMIIAGATGMGKSVCINSIIISILYKARPEDVKLILIDPKKVEFNLYKDMPHLYAPIVSEPKKAAGALASAVAEMERRFELIEEVGVRDITSYNIATESDPYKEHLPHMVIIIDELADLMMTAPDEVETAICRLAQKARAAGIHIIIGTQRPSVDVITGLIKANIPSRIACTVASQVDSRTIIDIAGAEKLIGRGDMLFAPVGASKPIRVQGAFVSDSEVENVTTFVRENNAKAKYNSEFINRLEEAAAGIGQKKSSGGGDTMAISDVEGGDDKFTAAVKLAVEEGKISTSLMQRRLGVGYGRAAKIIDTMEDMGYVSKPDGNKPRRVLLTAEEYARRVEEGTLGGGDE
ncbi:MAG: DNA translocase FtsK [Clostridia bacterium]|nr:DNA translocase FtsK [Clostridia bacterium]